jgi:hypothetical protein
MGCSLADRLLIAAASRRSGPADEPTTSASGLKAAERAAARALVGRQGIAGR